MKRTNMLPEAGFTLIELLIAIVIGAILAAVAVPSYRNFTLNNCQTNNGVTLVASLHLARSEAIKRRTRVGIRQSSTANPAGSNWGAGWTVWQDDDDDGVIDAGEPTLRVVELGCENTTITETGSEQVFAYAPDGMIDQTGTFDICDSRTGETGRKVSISVVGRPGTSECVCNDGDPEKCS